MQSSKLLKVHIQKTYKNAFVRFVKLLQYKSYEVGCDKWGNPLLEIKGGKRGSCVKDKAEIKEGFHFVFKKHGTWKLNL